ncbi:hypothetical protein ARMSODRAFT_225150 [Armillaria solidipes]|uniref:Uncharacterized protein n=1 Tax=Armillaria solidipes TaxID=1076256 RepID=A0A2H3CDH8_9AGAR|nr:hypothetical protein ARMSODRAFT_225150 [Armillaria solidipes]
MIPYKIRGPTQYPDFGTSSLLPAMAVLLFRSSVPPSMACHCTRVKPYHSFWAGTVTGQYNMRSFTHNSDILTDGGGVWRKSLKYQTTSSERRGMDDDVSWCRRVLLENS